MAPRKRHWPNVITTAEIQTEHAPAVAPSPYFHYPEPCIVEGYLKPSLVLSGDSFAGQLFDCFLGHVT